MGTNLGTTLGTKFHPPTLVKVASKGNKWFVYVTKPPELQAYSKTKQVRRSTGTTDKRRAEAVKSEITSKIYEEFQKEIDDIYLRSEARKVDPAAVFTSQITAEPNTVFISDSFTINRLGLDKDPRLRISRLIPEFAQHLDDLNKETRKERRTKISKIKEFISVVDDLNVLDVKKQHAYKYAKWMAQEDRANKTIRSNISRVTSILVWAEQEGYIEFNPFVQLHLKDYGAKSKPWLTFSKQELVDIFAQEMLKEDRLALTLLATTGARLDEIALLDWSQVKREYDIVYLDLTEAKVKNVSSRRLIPVHSTVAGMLETDKTGRIFSYALDKDGKAQSDAGKQLAKYVDSITDDPQKVIHSFRGTFKDLLRNAGMTQDMMSQLESGELTLDEVSQTLDEKSVSKELNDRITGHAQTDIAGKYGVGHHLIPRAAAIEKIDVSFIGGIV